MCHYCKCSLLYHIKERNNDCIELHNDCHFSQNILCVFDTLRPFKSNFARGTPRVAVEIINETFACRIVIFSFHVTSRCFMSVFVFFLCAPRSEPQPVQIAALTLE